MSQLQEYLAIERTVQTYVNGGMKGDSKEMSKAFHKDAIIHGIYHGEVFGGPIQKLYDFSEGAPAPNLQAKITNIDITGTAAIVRIELVDWAGVNFTDYFTLVKFDEGWLITAKVFMEHK